MKAKRYVEMANHLFATYESAVMPHGDHMFKPAYDMPMSTICTYLSYKYP